jgi:pyrimidine operon attenuation protein / uracil phosphoribosyltransferase
MNAPKLSKTLVLSEQEIENTSQRIAYEILERRPSSPISFVGIHTRGVIFAERVFNIVSQKNPQITTGTLDITLYRDDLDNLGTIPSVKGCDITFDVNKATIILFDDVLFTGRTIRAAIDVLMDYGRPAKIELAVLIDRGNRELPISADYTGRVVKTRAGEYVSVRFHEKDGSEGVYLLREEKPNDQSDNR